MDNSDNDLGPHDICRLEWLVWAIDAARRHCGEQLPSADFEEPLAGPEPPDPQP